jgi:hypothetical protein
MPRDRLHDHVPDEPLEEWESQESRRRRDSWRGPTVREEDVEADLTTTPEVGTSSEPLRRLVEQTVLLLRQTLYLQNLQRQAGSLRAELNEVGIQLREYSRQLRLRSLFENGDLEALIASSELSNVRQTAEELLIRIFGERATMTPMLEKNPEGLFPDLVFDLRIPRDLRDHRDAYLDLYARQVVVPHGAPVPVLVWSYLNDLSA